MFTLLRNSALAVTAATMMFTATGEAQAAPEAKLRIAPGPGYIAPVPKLGFNSYFNGFGEKVTFVRWGSRAGQIGLEPGDTIVRVNGVRLNYHGAWHQAMQNAAAMGQVQMLIRDWRTGAFVHRTVWLGYPGPGPGPGPFPGPYPYPMPTPKTAKLGG